MTLQVATKWFTGCTYTRIAPPVLGSVSGTDPVVQVLQTMPYGKLARSLEAKMQRLLLLSTADNCLLLMQWSESNSGTTTGSGNLVLLDQLRLPSPILQFLRKEPEGEGVCTNSILAGSERDLRLLRSFPWEADSLLRVLPTDESQPGHSRRDCGSTESDGSTIGGSSDAREGDGVDTQSQRPPVVKMQSYHIGSLSRDFRSYGLAMVEKRTGRVLRSLDEHTLNQLHKSTGSQGQILSVAPLPSHPKVLVAIVRSEPLAWSHPFTASAGWQACALVYLENTVCCLMSVAAKSSIRRS